MGSNPLATAGGFVEGAGHGSMMVADAFTFHQVDSLHAEVTELIDTHGGAYGAAYGVAHGAAAVTYVAGGIAVGGAVAGAGGVGAIAPPLALVGGGTTGGATIAITAGGVIGGGVVIAGGGAAAAVTAEYILYMEDRITAGTDFPDDGWGHDGAMERPLDWEQTLEIEQTLNRLYRRLQEITFKIWHLAAGGKPIPQKLWDDAEKIKDLILLLVGN